MELELLVKSVPLFDEEAAKKAQLRWDSLAKPVGSLGLLERAVVALAGAQGTEFPKIDRRAVLVLCADNGVTAQGVASTPPEITAVMAKFIAQKRSSVCIMAKRAGAESIAVDMGMFRRVNEPGLLERRVGDGTKDITREPAMTREQAFQAIETGVELAKSCHKQGYQILATGEMGIGNTTTSSAVASVLLDRSPAEMTGVGAGLDDAGLKRKVAAVERAIAINSPDPGDPVDVLQKLGGFDIAGMIGLYLGGALCRIPVLVDGFISATAALLACRICPAVSKYLLFSHKSAEPASRAVLDALGAEPPIHAGMRLGEGTGAVALLPLLDLALAVYNDLMTFADIGM
ncbi:MAG: nicotinate-nucleotide--dimethylbenzimidazole phosphoribosyltransferase [Eubacteriales bacterium]|nr:nicotinate-nucleotide--dimethylbenzimidazole phosphoribosyltransferase [Eubacteriales bacterium]